PQVVRLAGQPESMREATAVRQSTGQGKRFICVEKRVVEFAVKRADHSRQAVAANAGIVPAIEQSVMLIYVRSIERDSDLNAALRRLQIAREERRHPGGMMRLKRQLLAALLSRENE